ncbi:hypothetical protein [Streptomyces sp. N2A]|uniref:hypothetical protein n=1 Tax=Streptomyces sp. N2A TaxID=3073936 RepID=UPI0028700F3D|nr:hypothetical protein [Streptomyces sp. N2A]
MIYDQDWDRRLNPFRYNADGTLTDAAKRQNVTMELNSAGHNGGGGRAGHQASVRTSALTKAARALDELQGDTDKVDQHTLTETDAASNGLRGWQTAGGLFRLHRRWAEESVHLSAMLFEANVKLRETRSSYERTEHGEKARMDSIDGGRS